jgi:hypothetical protein
MRDPAFAKLVVLVNGAVPLAMLAWDALQHRLGADPAAFAIRTTGMLTIVFLLLSLTVTPARLLTGWNWLSHFRRMLGLYAFFYGTLHLCLYFVLEQSLSVSSTIADIVKPFHLRCRTKVQVKLHVPLHALLKVVGARRLIHLSINLGKMVAVFAGRLFREYASGFRLQAASNAIEFADVFNGCLSHEASRDRRERPNRTACLQQLA